MSKSLASGEITAERYSTYIDALWPKIIKKEVDENGADVLRCPHHELVGLTDSWCVSQLGE